MRLKLDKTIKHRESETTKQNVKTKSAFELSLRNMADVGSGYTVGERNDAAPNTNADISSDLIHPRYLYNYSYG